MKSKIKAKPGPRKAAYRNPAFEFDSIASIRADDRRPAGRNGRENLYGDIPNDVVIGKEELFDKYFKSNDGNIDSDDNEKSSVISKTSLNIGCRKPKRQYLADDKSLADDDDFVIIGPSGKWEIAKLNSYGDEISSVMKNRQSASDVTKRQPDTSDIDISRSSGKPNRGEGKHRPKKHRESSGVPGMTEDEVENQQKLTGLGQAVGSRNTVTSASASQPNNQRSTLRSCVYYQNRFIVLDPHEGRRSTEGYTNNSQQNRGSRDRASNSPRAGDQDSNEETSFSTSKREGGRMSDIQRKPGNRRNMEMDASSVTMDARGIEIILTDPENSSRHIAAENKEKNNTVWKKINRFLQDNRMKGNPDSDRILNTDHPEEYRVLKKVLNLSFLTIGILLFLAVIIVVIYAFVVGDPPNDPDTSSEAGDTTDSLKT